MIRVKKVYFQDLSVGVDMGEIYAFSSFCENGHASIITGRKLRSRQCAAEHAQEKEGEQETSAKTV
ncbi:hypothetical protein AM501_07290 [Aneurinibacillus migulanus]|nr:hypothetical protein [Aneurinibacillus migulanus]KIV53732.1 hypothetical protein TS64_17505 [Aneurinibacillus migulanus]KPD08911.1 hypothetical protein AM501_07290 [Aneurinibacillus migulanus]